MSEREEFKIEVFEDFIGLYVSPFCQTPTEGYTLDDMKHSFNAGIEACAERKDAEIERMSEREEFETIILPIVVSGEPDAKIVRLKIDHQSFNIGEYYENLEQAEFMANNLTIALNRLIESKLSKQAEELAALRGQRINIYKEIIDNNYNYSKKLEAELAALRGFAKAIQYDLEFENWGAYPRGLLKIYKLIDRNGKPTKLLTGGE